MNKTENKSFCIMPWIHLHVAQNGNIIPCCQAPPQKVHRLGNINEQSISEIWNGERIKSFRKKMLNGVQDVRCKQCYLKEANGLESLRQKSNETYHDGAIELNIESSSPPVYFDFRFSNTCNLKCRICGPWASSQWFKEAVALGMRKPNEKAISLAIRNEDSFFEEMEPFFKTAKEFYFAGGEPLMMEQHYRILDELIAAKNTDCKLNYNTNFSKLSFKGFQILEYWKKFKNIKVSASLDAEGERGEFLRKNIKWETIIENRKMILKELPSLSFEVNPTVCIFNVEHILDFHKNWVDQKLISVEDFVPNILFNPKEYQINILPIEKQLELKTKYQKHINWIKKQTSINKTKLAHILIQFDSIEAILGQPSKPKDQLEFVSKTNKLDALRNETFENVFPELSSIK
jgi:radical SAM protein with 4Fe4S-binding SPASM domain